MRINRKEVTIVTHCPFCRKVNEVSTNEMDWLAWECGANAQDAFPYLSSAEREMVMSGICPTCWEQMIGEEEEEE